MTEYVYGLADVDGTLCVTSEGAAWDKPELHKVHWPTIASTYNFCRYHEITPDQLGLFKVKQSRPGEYWIEDSRYHYGTRGSYLELVNGGQTQSVKLTVRENPRPRTRCQCEYRDGHWWKNMASGWKRV